MPTVTEAINRFLASQENWHPGFDLIQRFLTLGGATTLEVQVNAAADGGEPVEGRRHTWTDGNLTWFNIRVPKNANTKPEFNDYEMYWPLELHAEGVGCTGFDWKNLRSRWVAYDFDAITGHAKGVGISEEMLAQIKERAKADPTAEIRLSTGGAGLHIYKFFDGDGIPTANHNEHAALARCILGQMSELVGFDFASQIDACGHIMWLWHRKLTRENRGLSLLKAAERNLTIADLPPNWLDHLAVVTRRQTKIRLQGVDEKSLDPFEMLTSSRRIIPLDEIHKATIQELMETGFSTVWVTDHHLLQTHTKALEKLMTDPKIRAKLGLIGTFKTNSPGTNPGQANCFLFPLNNGGWRVYRFSPGISEEQTWVQDGQGWTTCFFNRLPDLDMACRSYGGQRDPDHKALYVFPTGEKAIAAARSIGQTLELEPEWKHRQVSLERTGNGTLAVRVAHKKGDSEEIAGWIKKKSTWVRDLNQQLPADDKNELGATDFDDIIRATRAPSGDTAGWMHKSTNGEWGGEHSSNVKMVLQSAGQSKPEAEVIMGGCSHNPWKLVSLPFQSEYPGARQWNRKAPQFLYPIAELKDDEVPQHPHWDLILNHVGTELTPVLRALPWAREHGILTGAQYLLCWFSALVRHPFRQLPYIFLWGNENCGKSILYEAFSYIVTRGVIGAAKVLTTTGDFNGELEGAVLCYVEELDLSHHKVALPRIKEYVTAYMIPLRKMRLNTYQIPNTTHWIQVANDRNFCPVFKGDTRIVVIRVPDLLPEQEIPKFRMKEYLRQEAPHFIYSLMNCKLPPPMGRLQIPIVETESKLDIAESNRTPLQIFLDTKVQIAPGYKIRTSTLFAAYQLWCKENNHPDPNIVTFVKEHCFHTWRGSGGVRFIPNYSLSKVPPVAHGNIEIIDAKPHYRDANGNLQRLTDAQIPGDGL